MNDSLDAYVYRVELKKPYENCNFGLIFYNEIFYAYSQGVSALLAQFRVKYC